MANAKKSISILVPVYNEGQGIGWFHNELLKTIHTISGYTFEIVFVHDGSLDNSFAEIQRLKNAPGVSIKIIDLSRNFGKESALSAGFANITSNAVLCLDADGQFPIDYIPQFIKKWEAGAEVVVGVRGKNFREGFMKRYGSKIFYQLFNKVTGNNMVPRSTDFRLIDRKVVDAFNALTERNRMTRSLIDWLGYKREYIDFDANPRKFGTPTYTFNKLLTLAMNTFISLSAVPLFLAGYLGIFFMAVGFAGSIFALIEQVILNDPMHINLTGTAMLGILIIFLVGVILAAQGLIGLYLARVLGESQGRPLYVIRSITNVGSKN